MKVFTFYQTISFFEYKSKRIKNDSNETKDKHQNWRNSITDLNQRSLGNLTIDHKGIKYTYNV